MQDLWHHPAPLAPGSEKFRVIPDHGPWAVRLVWTLAYGPGPATYRSEPATGDSVTAQQVGGSPISGASMNPARTFGPDPAGTTFTSYWVHVAGPIAGAVLAVGIALVQRGQGGGKSGAGAAQGDLGTQPYESGRS